MVRKARHKECTCEIWNPGLQRFKSYCKCKHFQVCRSRTRSRSQGKKIWYKQKGHITRNVHIEFLLLMIQNLWIRLNFLWQTDGQMDGQTDGRPIVFIKVEDNKQCDISHDWLDYQYIKGFAIGLMVDMASKKIIIQAVLCPTQLFKWKLICTFNLHCFSYKISNRLQFNSSLFPHKLFKCCNIDTLFFSKCATRWKHV